MRIKLSRLFGFFLFMAILFLGCRSENDFVENNIIIEKTPQKFYIFETKNNSAFYSKNAEGFDYANAFGYMAQRFDSINKTNITGLINTDNLVIYKKSKKQFFIEVNKVPYIEFRIHSQPVIYDNQDVVMMYPKINEGIVIELVVAVLTDNETQLYFRTLNKDDEIFIENISKFQQVYDRNFRDKFSKDSLGKNILSGRGGDIEEVVIIVIRDLGSGPRVGFPSSGIGQGQGGGCGGFDMCQPPAGEGGGDGEPNDPNLNQTDPCAKAREFANEMTEILNNNDVKTAIQMINNLLQQQIASGQIKENAFVIGVDSSGKYHVSSVSTAPNSNPHSAGYYPFDSNSGITQIGVFHNHTTDNSNSPGDFYELISSNVNSPNYLMNFAQNSLGEVFALNMYDRQKAMAFLQKYPKEQNIEGPNFKGELLDEYERFRSSADWSVNDNINAGQVALIAFLEKFHTGVSLSKQIDLSNFKTFKSSNFNETVYGGQQQTTYTTSDCN